MFQGQRADGREFVAENAKRGSARSKVNTIFLRILQCEIMHEKIAGKIRTRRKIQIGCHFCTLEALSAKMSVKSSQSNIEILPREIRF